MVERAKPVIRAIKLTPPRPSARASKAANRPLMPFFAVCGSTDSLFYGRALKENEQLKDRVEIKRSPRLVRSFFRAESVG